MKPERRPITYAEFERLVEKHSGVPQCLTCRQPQRCTIGRLLDSITPRRLVRASGGTER